MRYRTLQRIFFTVGIASVIAIGIASCSFAAAVVLFGVEPGEAALRAIAVALVAGTPASFVSLLIALWFSRKYRLHLRSLPTIEALPAISNARPGQPLDDIPQEPLRTGRLMSAPPAHVLHETPTGMVLRASRYPLYLGVVLTIVFIVVAVFLPKHVWEYLASLEPLFLKWGAIVGILVALFLATGGPMLFYLATDRLGQRVTFDEAEEKVYLRREGIVFPLQELVAVQICYERWKTAHRWDLNLVRRDQAGRVHRYEIMSAMGPIQRMAERLSQRFSIPLIDCATPEHRQAELQHLALDRKR